MPMKSRHEHKFEISPRAKKLYGCTQRSGDDMKHWEDAPALVACFICGGGWCVDCIPLAPTPKEGVDR